MKFKITTEIVNERLESRGIILVGDYLGTHVKTKFQCVCGHTWMNDPHSIFAGVGCPSCRYSLVTMENINLELERKGKNIRMVTEYGGPETKTKFKCPEGHIWDAVPRRVLGGTGCPHCKIQKTRTFD